MRSVHMSRLDGTGRGAVVPAVASNGYARPMLDIVLVAAGLGFFALAIGYVSLCERL